MLSNFSFSLPQGGLSEGLGHGLSTLRQATSIFGICTRILMALEDVVDSVGVIDRCSGEPVDRFSLKSVD
ncbi:hypothetical protein F2Q69_00022592 [Brassica cretica]|uniref:Uncharacterized protein n=1 Tax=Brassica cretica TaxID=69181 RepID=A0A8S9QLM2_BRACR|nr:hypothetical protein F2Q69_00022592 [Brassica cretica]